MILPVYLFSFLISVNAQFFFQQPFQQFFNQPNQFQQNQFQQNQFQPNIFQQFFQPQTTTQATTTLEPIPDPDKEQGNFPLPNPKSWPVGPDWNDPRNNFEHELGWGGKDVKKSVTTPIVTPKPKLNVIKKKTPEQQSPPVVRKAVKRNN